MSEIINLGDYRKQRETECKNHASGPARCMQCGNEWHAVAPLGTVHLECSECGTDAGVFLYPYIPELYWSCECGHPLFYLTPKGPLCTKCGKTDTEYLENIWSNDSNT